MEAARNFLAVPGKGLRTDLVNLGWTLAGGEDQPPLALSAGIELLHAGSLIIDDIEEMTAETELPIPEVDSETLKHITHFYSATAVESRPTDAAVSSDGTEDTSVMLTSTRHTLSTILHVKARCIQTHRDAISVNT